MEHGTVIRAFPRAINPKETFERLVSAIQNTIVEDRIPGIIVGVSGTDSLVAFLAVYEAYKNLGTPERALAVNFVHNGQKEMQNGGIQCEGGDKNWFAKEIMPWLTKRAPGATLEINDSIPFSDDNKRWGEIFSRAISEVQVNRDLGGNYRYVMGTRNRTEKELGSYSIISRNPSLQLLEHLYKTEILQISEYLGVPQIALEKSREVDCECGRFDVQAHHLDELDYFIMTEQGELSPEYLETIDPVVLTAVREFYVEERERNRFRDEIPKVISSKAISFKGADIETALKVIKGDIDDIRPVSYVTPQIIEDKNREAAHVLLSASSGNNVLWRAESFALAGVDPKNSLEEITGRIGQYCFSFPAKRFTTQGFDNGPSLIERAGFERHERDTDVRNANLPKSNPERDEFGTGFTWQDENLYVEQRRAYTIVSDLSHDKPVTLLIRNSSYHFGRDRLPEPAYVSWEPKTGAELLELTAKDIADPFQFSAWDDILKAGCIDDEHLKRVSDALDVMDSIDLKFSQWLRGSNPPRFKTGHESLKKIFSDNGGIEHLRGFLKTAFIQHAAAEKPGSPFYLASIGKGAAPWQPKSVVPVTTDVLAQLKDARITDRNLRDLFKPSPLHQRQLVMLSGRNGDLPIKPEI